MSHELLAATTSATQSSEFSVAQKKSGAGLGFVGDSFPVTITADNLAGSEVATLQIKSGSTWLDAEDSDGNAIELAASGSGYSRLEIYSPGVYRIDKDATASACAIYLHTPSNP